jgi:streptogramin lyase
MKSLEVCAGLVVLLANLPSVGLAQASGLSEGFGFAVAAPQGADWTANPDPAKIPFVAFFKYIGDPADQHTVLAAVRTSWVTDCDDHETCLAKAEAVAGEGPGVTKYELSKEGVDRPTCQWLEQIEEDRRSKKNSLEVHVSGLFCTHPDEPRLIVQATLSERLKKGQRSTSDFKANARAFVNRFEFRPIAATVTSIVEVGEGSGYIEPASGSLWIHGREFIHRLDLRSRDVERRFRSTSDVLSIASAADSVWISNGSKRQLLRLRPLDGVVQAKIDLPVRPYTVKKGFGSLWITPYKKTSVMRLDPRSGEVIAEIEVGKGNSELAIGKTSVWISEYRESDIIRRIDPATNAVVGTVQPCVDPLGIAEDPEFLWVACNGSRTIVRIDPATHKKTGSVFIGGSPALLDSDGETVWVTHFDSGKITAVDVETVKVIVDMPLGKAMSFPRVVDESSWITDIEDSRVYEVRRQTETGAPSGG